MSRLLYTFIALLNLISLPCEGALEKYFRTIENCAQSNPFKNIDSIYLINLDQRPERLNATLQQLAPYGIVPYRLSAIYGWALSPQDLHEIGMKFSPGMQGDRWALHYPLDGRSQHEVDFLRETSYGKAYFACWSSKGSVGCLLSHLSVLQHAYDAGYEIIWVLEDDVLVNQNPLQLSDLVDQLDALVGKEGWDILYTDLDTQNRALYPAENDFESDLKGPLWFIWRPDLPSYNMDAYRGRTIISSDFLRIHSRMRTHSMVIRRSAMKKILDHEKQHGIFLPYDHELAVIAGLQLFSLRYPLVTSIDQVSDTREQYFQLKE